MTTETKTKHTVILSDGYNGGACRFFSVPIERDGALVKLQCAETGKEYMHAWKFDVDVIKAMEEQRERHTPGPWRVEICLGETLNTFSVLDEENKMGFIPEIVVPVSEHDHFHREAEANACLIAAAPELLAALQKAVTAIHEVINFDSRIDSRSDWLRKREFGFATISELETAIRRAKGE